MARPRKHSPDQTVENLLKVFWSGGYDATALSDIVAQTKLGKGSLYAAFGDKRAMFLRALAAYDAQYVDGAVALMTGLNGKEAIFAFLDLPAQAVESGDLRGCFLCNTTMETETLDAAARQLAKTSRNKLHAALVTAWSQQSGDQNPIAAQAAATQLLAFYFGLRVLARSGTSAEVLRTAVAGYQLP